MLCPNLGCYLAEWLCKNETKRMISNIFSMGLWIYSTSEKPKIATKNKNNLTETVFYIVTNTLIVSTSSAAPRVEKTIS